MKKKLVLFFIFLTYCSFCQSHTEVKLPYHIDGYDTFVFKNNGLLYTALGKVCYDGKIDSVRTLIKQGLDTDYCAIDEIYAYDVLWIAIDRGDVKMVEELLRIGVNVDGIYSDDGSNALSKSCSLKNHNISLQIVKLMIDKGLNVNGVGDVGGLYVTYPIVIAAENNNIEVIKLLIEKGANINVSTAGVTPLEAAIKNKNKDIEKLLIQNIDKEKTH